jgi:demethylmenaquinone methyltransferase/2-methoxy-6-polyprenyl-1,4-benzoquinol methylase
MVRNAGGGAAPPVPPPGEKAAAVRNMFGAIAPRYDFLNHLLSLNTDRRWRRRAVDRLLRHARPDGVVLDACAGTLDLAREVAGRDAFRGRVMASDFAVPMLERGVAKVERLPVSVVCADTLQLPTADATLDGAIVGFGVRNLADLGAGLAEFARVLRPGAPLVILEFTTPSWQPFRGLYLFYFRHVLPLIGRLVSRHRSAYDYLPATVLEFPSPPRLAAMMRDAGFGDVEWTALSGGIAAIHVGLRTPHDKATESSSAAVRKASTQSAAGASSSPARPASSGSTSSRSA